ncbi:MAG: dipicolinate synthase subunit DpsA [Clostridia bacterium]|nr:dipicolinate synthase subunit DpsA [Clostridia bacterium]
MSICQARTGASNPGGILVIGGDVRFVLLCGCLADRGFEVRAAAMEKAGMDSRVSVCSDIPDAVKQSRHIIMPMPMTKPGGIINAPLGENQVLIDELLGIIGPGKTVFGGIMPQEIKERIAASGSMAFDYAALDSFAVKNAVPTAEGAVEIAIRETPFTIEGSRCLTIGYGRVAAALVKRLGALGAKNTVAVRREQVMGQISEDGYFPIYISEINQYIADADIVFNTVPSLILDEYALRNAGKNALIIDLASKPGGVDFECADRLGIKTVHALSLPGKTAPLTAAEIIADTVVGVIGSR